MSSSQQLGTVYVRCQLRSVLATHKIESFSAIPVGDVSKFLFGTEEDVNGSKSFVMPWSTIG
jgi:hypothetical protein